MFGNRYRLLLRHERPLRTGINHRLSLLEEEKKKAESEWAQHLVGERPPRRFFWGAVELAMQAEYRHLSLKMSKHKGKIGGSSYAFIHSSHWFCMPCVCVCVSLSLSPPPRPVPPASLRGVSPTGGLFLSFLSHSLLNKEMSQGHSRALS